MDSKEIPMLPQAVVLLQHLLNASDYFLKDKEIEILFWSDKSCNTSRTYNVVGRLRKVLEKTSFIKIDRIGKAEMTGYQLVFLKVDESSMKSV